MKKLNTWLVAAMILFLAACGGKKLKFETAKEYNDYVVQVVHEVDDAWKDAIQEKDLNESLKKADILTQKSKEGLDKLNNLQAFKKDKLFKGSCVSYVTLIHKISQKELKEFLNLIHTDSPDQNRLDELIRILDGDRESKFHLITVCQQVFAEKYNLNLKPTS
jgi:predicted small lipoprotein YifL